MEILTYPFMQRALVAALLTGLIAPTIGIYIVQKRLSLLGDGLGHVAIAGVGLALLTGTAPLPVAIVVAIGGAILIEYLRQHQRASGDVGLAILFYGGLAGGVFMSGLAGAGGLNQYLFGSITTISNGDLVMIVVLSVVALVVSLGLADRLFAVSTDEEYARTLGLPVGFYNYLIVVLAAVAISLSMRTVGLLLVSALMVVPVAASRNLANGFWHSLLLAMAIGILAAGGGIVGSYYWNAPPGALIVLLAIGVFVASLPIGTVLTRRRRRSRLLPVAEEIVPPPHQQVEQHPHVHGGPDCHHPTAQHADHVDYLHDGHRHAMHGDHYDEH
ncbi:zinc transport system permease protein [Raineyella antarctica]|uniref:Zinc transport system permease protein n=1 Tax=Raineyella antarctica TaxID=1577474 RepID=A0A1G6GWZ8_9ACTN|nr:metal ABC transporter permease [Raineyella antarctica]SDB86494.1 zinc transport system permease protein [Raineyella antarctica]